jgi:hypothetical protein
MPLVMATLQSQLQALFESMQDGSKDDYDMADELSSIVKDFMESGTIVTTDLNSVPITSPGPYIAGMFVGGGQGSLSVQDGPCASLIKVACDTMRAQHLDDNYLADKITEGIDLMRSAGIVTCNITGVVTIPGSPPIVIPNVPGTTTGTITCVPTPLAAGLKACFLTMRNMTTGGDAYFATQLATLINSYMLANTVATVVDVASLLTPVIGAGAMI